MPRRDPQEPIQIERRVAMTWAQRLERVFGIDTETCSACGRGVQILTGIEDLDVLGKIPTDLDAKAAEPETRDGRHARRRRCGGSLTRRGGSTMTSFGLGYQPRGGGGSSPGDRCYIEKRAGKPMPEANLGTGMPTRGGSRARPTT